MSNGYTRTTLIECARSQSEEAKSFNNENPSLWTNQVGTGLHLKPGDQISVHSSFVSEIGAESGQIQIKGQELGASVNVEVTDFDKKIRNEDLPQKFTLVNCSNKSQNIKIRDDTLNLIVSPYKCAQGDNYCFLPRRYTASGLTGTPDNFWRYYSRRDGLNVVAAYDTGQTHKPPNELNRCDADISAKYWPYREGIAHTVHRIDGKNDGSRFTLFTRTQTFYGDPSTPDVVVKGKATAGSPIITLTHGYTTKDLIKGMELTDQSPDVVFPEPPLATVISEVDHINNTVTMDGNASANTNTHNIFTFSVSASLSDQYLPPSQSDGYSASFAEGFRDPATFGEYIQVKNLISVKANAGYNSPTDLADQLTQELNERTDIEYFEYDTTDAAGTYTKKETFTFKTESPCFKMYNCATAHNFNKKTFDEWFKTDGSWNVNNAYHYLSCYQHILLKRPELYNAGKKLNASTGINLDDEGYDAHQINEEVFVTGIEFTEENLKLFRDFFDAQATYPELFDNYNQNNIPVSAERCRFIHMNLFDEENNPDALINPSDFGTNIRDNRTGQDSLGYDLYNSAVSASQTSFPLFCDFNPDTVNLTSEDVSYTSFIGQNTNGQTKSDYNQLVYGFARKVFRRQGTIGSEPYFAIGLQFTQTGNKIPDHFFHANAEASDQYELGTGNGRRFGFDYHFTSYGCLPMMLLNGNADYRGQNYNGGGTNPYVKQYRFGQATAGKLYSLDKYQFGYYLGADEPVINYDVDQQRFLISNLHQSEVVGNSDSAGYNQTAKIPVNPEAATPCYKINKRMLETNYSPEFVPYIDGFSGSFTGGSVNTFESHNVGVEPYRIFDANGGLFIEDWIVPEKNWNDSLVGTMGFRYEQFHNPNSTSSRQVRLKSSGANAKLNNVNIITTNADIPEADIYQYQQNLTNADLMLSVNTVGVMAAGTGFSPHGRYITPAITVKNPGSVNITAQRLPTKTLRPYYTIRSNIIHEQNSVLGGARGGITLPIVAITNKANPYADFLNGFGSELVFTNTIDRVLTKVVCSIHEPDGTFARTDLNSAVIFKIDQQINANLDLVQTLLQSKDKQDQETAELAEEPELEFQNVKYTKDLFE